MSNRSGNPNIEIIEKAWRSGRSCVGIILAGNKETGRQCAYMGVASLPGYGSEDHDAKRIIDYGYRMTFEEAFPFLDKIDLSKYCDKPDGLMEWSI